MAQLRAEDGCPWDREQTLASLQGFLVEETYEVLDAIEQGDPAAHCEELGDVLFQIVFQCQLAKEAGHFDLEDVVDRVARKIIRRHPHVFASESAGTSQEVIQAWERIKRDEKQEKSKPGQTRPLNSLADVPRSLPALMAAHNLSERAARTGFDWENAEQVLTKVEEEYTELKEALENRQDRDGIAWELGDLIFSLSNLARHLNLRAEELVRQCNQRFRDRFGQVEQFAEERGVDMAHAGIKTLESLWQEAKNKLAKK